MADDSSYEALLQRLLDRYNERMSLPECLKVLRTSRYLFNKIPESELPRSTPLADGGKVYLLTQDVASYLYRSSRKMGGHGDQLHTEMAA